MHIAFICREYLPSFRAGGIASYIHETAIGLAERGHKITVICASDHTKQSSDTQEGRIRVIRLSGGDFLIPAIEPTSPLRKVRCLYRFFSYRKKIRKQLQQINDIDIIEVAEYGAEAYYLKQLNIPTIIRLHTPTLLDRKNAGLKEINIHNFHEHWVGKQELKLLPQFRHITSCSESLKQWAIKYVPKISTDIRVIYNSVELKKWLPESPTNYHENTILYAGTVAEEKGVGDLLEACWLLRKENIPVNLKIAGKMGSYAIKLSKYATDKGLDWCVFLGNTPREQLKALYGQAKISCFPSWWEGMGIVCLEAMVAGNIVIGSNYGGMAELIENGISGYLIEPKNPQALAHCLRKALSASKADVENMKQKAKRRVHTKFSTETILSTLEDYYSTVIKQHKNNENSMG